VSSFPESVGRLIFREERMGAFMGASFFPLSPLAGRGPG
jgi:hypothetical protein